MIPFLHLGPISLPTYGLMVATGLLVAAYILQAEFDRRRGELQKIKGYEGHKDDAFLVIGIAGMAGLIGSRIYSAVENPTVFFAHPASILLSRYGFTWFGGLFGGFVTLVFIAWRWKIPLLDFLDMCSAPGAAGYAFGRMGCFLSGDGDYGIPTKLPWGMSFPNGIVPTTERVHPTPIYEFVVWIAIAAFLWHMGTKALNGPKARGEIFANYLILTSIARFLVEYIRVNPRLTLQDGHLRWIDYEPFSQLASHSWFAFTNAQLVSLTCILAGAVLLWRIKSQFHALKKEHRIVDHIAVRGDVLQTEYSKPTPECPHPERWHMYDSMTAEVEVLDFLRAIVTTVKPELIVETGTFSGLSTLRFAEGLKANGVGKVITCEYDAKVFAAAKKRFAESGLEQWIEARNESSLEMKVNGCIDLLFCDSDTPIREQEARRFLPQMSPYGLVLMHDASSSMKTVREAALRLEQEGLLSVLLLPTPRGLVMAQKREGRQ